MRRDMKAITKELSNNINSRNRLYTINSIFYCMPISEEATYASKKYGNYTLYEFMSLLKISRLRDMGIITELEKEALENMFLEYEKMQEEHKKVLLSGSKKDNQDFYAKTKELKDRLESYGILQEIDFEGAIINKIDEEIKSKLCIEDTNSTSYKRQLGKYN